MNPFKEGTTSHYDYEIMKDLNWHCTKCELKSGQAKTWQIWRQEKGLQLDQDEKGNWYKKQDCQSCGQSTIHRKLRSLEINEGTIARSGITPKLAKKIKTYYGGIDAYTLRKEPLGKLEIDHRLPQVRWNQDEKENDVNMSEEEIKKRFMLLTRENNLLKSRKCEKCKQTGKRQKGYDLHFFYKGQEEYEDSIGCEGCFWFDPDQWRQALNEFIVENNK
jgi:hypothetical protein